MLQFQTKQGFTYLQECALTVRLHGDVGIEMIQCAIGLLTAIPPTFVHALDFFVSSTGALMLLGARNRNEGVYLGQVMRLVN